MISRIIDYKGKKFFEVFCPECNCYLDLGEVIFKGEEVLCLIHNESERLGFKKDINNEYLSH